VARTSRAPFGNLALFQVISAVISESFYVHRQIASAGEHAGYQSEALGPSVPFDGWPTRDGRRLQAACSRLATPSADSLPNYLHEFINVGGLYDVFLSSTRFKGALFISRIGRTS